MKKITLVSLLLSVAVAGNAQPTAREVLESLDGVAVYTSTVLLDEEG